MNPFKENHKSIKSCFYSLDSMYHKPYSKNDTDAFTKTRVILMNGTEFEQNWFMHNLSRHCDNNDLRRDVALLRRMEQQQQKLLSSLKPIDESILETTIGYEQLAVDLTAQLAQNEPDKYVKAQLDFALLEDFDHLYRYADLLEFDQGIKAEKLVGRYTEIMPGRPTIAEHRHPFDEIKRHICSKTANPITKLNVNIITAAEQQTMNYYMNIGQFYQNDIGRKLYAEIAMIEEQHVTEYGSLIDTNCTWLEGLLMHEYVECYLYYSCMQDETHPMIKQVWQKLYEQELSHLKYAEDLLKKYEKKEACEVIPDGKFPKLLTFQPNIEYVRNVIKNTVENTAVCEDYANINDIADDYRFFSYQDTTLANVNTDPAHTVINNYIKEKEKDYRFQVDDHPIQSLNDRQKDNISIARKKSE